MAESSSDNATAAHDGGPLPVEPMAPARRCLGQRFRRAVVTGASSGLGAAFRDLLLAEGVAVIGTSRDPSRCAPQPGLTWLPLDLADGASMGHFLAELEPLWPEIDLLINNAGEGVFNRFEDFEPAQIGDQLRVLLHGPIALCHAALPHFLGRDHGTIVNVASLARDLPLPYFSLYNAAKAGLSNFSRSLHLDLSDTAVRVIDFQPGDYRTRFNAEAARPEDLHLDPALARAWATHERHLQAAPDPRRAAQDLRRALHRRVGGVITSGSFFQARLAPLLPRLAPWNLVRWAIRRYYRL